jgi:prepilin-type processing-associated H-X9-DG protein
MHPGGVNLALADASVHWISNYVETSGENGDGGRTLWAVWDRLLLSADGLPVDNKKAGL